jgi:ferredoxin-NADP reductase
LLYAVRNEDEIIFQKTFERTGIHTTYIVSEPTASWGGERGRLDAEKIIGIEEPTDDTLIYVSGPEPMVETLEADLKKNGIKKDQLVLDFFPNYPEY